jgi:hypothetical protein
MSSGPRTAVCATLLALLVACHGADDTAAPDATPADAATPALQVKIAPPDTSPWIGAFAQLSYTVGPTAARAERAEFYVDGVLDQVVDPVDMFDFGYHVIDWDPGDYAEGEHELRLLVTSTDGARGEDSLRLVFDLTPPAIVFTGTSVVDGHQVAHFDVTDHGAGVQRVELEVQEPNQRVFLEAPPYDIVLPDCTQAVVVVNAYDNVGDGAQLSQGVRVSRACDDDCDGHAAATDACGGDDCDDDHDSTHPGATDTLGDFHDQDCDGSDGVDADGDGVPSVASGGLDCDDTRADTHPAWWRWAIEIAASATVVPGGPTPYATIAAVGDRLRLAWLDHSGLSYVERDDTGHFMAKTLVDGDGYGVPQVRGGPRLAIGPDGSTSIAYGASIQRPLWMATSLAATFVTELVMPTENPLFNISLRALRIDPAGHRHVLASQGEYGSARYITDADGAWTTVLTSLNSDRTVDLFLRADATPRIVYFAYNVDGSASLALVRPTTGAISIDSVLVSGTFDYEAAAAQDAAGRIAVAYGDATRQLHLVAEGAPAVDLAGVAGHPVALLATASGDFHLFVSDDQGATDEYLVSAGHATRVARQVPGLAYARGAALAQDDHGEFHIAFVGGSAFHAYVDHRTEAAPDASGDGLDQDCDGTP